MILSVLGWASCFAFLTCSSDIAFRRSDGDRKMVHKSGHTWLT
jgi:hypothetical protein